MQDSWSYGEPARRRPTPPKPRLGKPLLAVGVAVLAAVVVFMLFRLVQGGAKTAGDAVRTQLKQVDVAGDVQAQSSARDAVMAARAYLGENGSYQGLSAAYVSQVEPSLSYVDGNQPSSGPQVVSVSGSASGLGVAVLSASGTCFWVHDSGLGALTYGSGLPCTGAAATAASSPAW